MHRKLTVNPWKKASLLKKEYDVFLTSLGYETRARYIAEAYSPKAKTMIAIAFTANNILSFNANKRFYIKKKFQILPLNDKQFYQWSHTDFFNLIKKKSNQVSKILVDISSMSRIRIATVISAIRSMPNNFSIELDFIYATAKFTRPKDIESPIVKSGPILPEFAGWSVNPSLPTGLILGLGYNFGKAIGTVEYIEPGELWLFNPLGGDERYAKEIFNANEILIKWLSNKSRVISYDIMRPYELFKSLESLCIGAKKISRPMIVPFGPKIFTTCSLLMASRMHPDISVWRITSDKFGKVHNKFASGEVVGLHTEFNTIK